MEILSVNDPAFGEVLATIHHRSRSFGAWSSAAYKQLLSQPAISALIAQNNETPTGFLLLSQTQHETEVLMLCVLPAFRRQGIAKHLLSELFLRLNSGHEVFLEVAESNHNAINLYTTQGFKEVGKRESYYESRDGKKDSALVMKRIIGPT